MTSRNNDRTLLTVPQSVLQTLKKKKETSSFVNCKMIHAVNVTHQLYEYNIAYYNNYVNGAVSMLTTYPTININT